MNLGQFLFARVVSTVVVTVVVVLARGAAVRRYGRRVGGTLALTFSACLLAGCDSGTRLSRFGYAIAYTTLTSPSSVQVRTSRDGSTWSAPSALFESSTIPPGIGATADLYLLAWFDSSNTLHTSASADGTTWAFHATHGTFPVDINSRPAVEYNFNTRSWLVAFTNTQRQIVVLPVDSPGGRAVPIAGVTSSSAPGLVWISPLDRLLLLYKDAGNRVVSLSSENGTSWPAGPGTSITSRGQEVVASNIPYVNRSGLAVWLAVKRLRSTGTLSTGSIRVYSYNGGEWELSTTLNRTDPFSRGPAVTGVDGALVVADTGRVHGTVMWRNGQEIGPLDTRTQYDISLAYGPRSDNTTPLPPLICGPCDRCVDALGGSLAPDYYRDCTDSSGNRLTFRCKVCDPCIGGTRFCRPTQFSDAPGFSEPPGPEPCDLCPPP